MIMKINNLDILFKQYYERLVLFAESYVGDMMIAEDMVQDVFLTVLSRPDFADVGYMRAYLYSCVRNNCVNYLRRLDIVDPLNVKLFDAVYYTGDFDLEEDVEYIIVSTIESDPLATPAKVSDQSPIGMALIGAKVGASVKVDTPKGAMKLKILEITK